MRSVPAFCSLTLIAIAAAAGAQPPVAPGHKEAVARDAAKAAEFAASGQPPRRRRTIRAR